MQSRGDGPQGHPKHLMSRQLLFENRKAHLARSYLGARSPESVDSPTTVMPLQTLGLSALVEQAWQLRYPGRK